MMLNQFYRMYRLLLSPIWLPFLLLSMLSACGGSGGSSTKSAAATSITSSSSNRSSSLQFSSVSSAQQSSAATVTLSGTVTYDFVPHNQNNVGLNYNSTIEKPVRGTVVQLLNTSGSVIATSNTDDNGAYTFAVPKNTSVKVRVRAQLLNNISPTWDFKVTDNTSNNSIYVLDGSLISTGNTNSSRNLHALSGWDGIQYSATRAAAPFAILDDIYTAVTHLSEAGNHTDLPALELRWSTKNNAADGDESLGEIGTSYFNGSAIYILGDANNDTDEYDSHVIVHEWGHYLEQNLFRSDSFGGNHTEGDKLDMRISMSEGFANGFASVMLDDPYYSDSSGSSQSSGFAIDISQKNNLAKGFYSEGSIGSLFYNYYISSTNKNANDFSSIVSVLSDSSYIDNEAMTSIFLFYARFKALLADQSVEFNRLMKEQNIFGTTEYADDETNNAGYSASLPIYKTVESNGAALNVCSSAQFGKFNKLANSQLVKLNITQEKTYSINITRSGGASVTTWPEAIVFNRGKSIGYFEHTQNNSVSGNLSLPAGNYVIEIYDEKNRDENNTQQNTTCFNVQVTAS